jgi:hypothetical protein
MAVTATRKELQVVCTGCSATLTYEPRDVEQYEDPPRGYETDSTTMYRITCPSCGKQRNVPYPGYGTKTKKELDRERHDEDL